MFILQRVRTYIEKYEPIRIVSGGVLLISFCTYIIVEIYDFVPFLLIDRLLTMPLLLYMVYLYASINGYDNSSFTILFVLSIILSTLSFLIYKSKNKIFVVIYIATLLSIFVQLEDIRMYLDKNNIPYGIIFWIIYIGWYMYILIYLLPDTQMTKSLYYVLDFFVKIVFIFVFNHLLYRSLKNVEEEIPELDEIVKKKKKKNKSLSLKLI